jgi:hypothetical protein
MAVLSIRGSTMVMEISKLVNSSGSCESGCCAGSILHHSLRRIPEVNEVNVCGLRETPLYCTACFSTFATSLGHSKPQFILELLFMQG